MVALATAAPLLVNAPAQQKGKQTASEELTVPNLGLKLIPFEVMRPNRQPVTAADVTAVQEGSTAYFTGIQPGDRILAVDGMSYLSPQQLLNLVNRTYRPDSPLGLVIDYLISTTGVRRDYRVIVDFEEPGSARGGFLVEWVRK